MVLVAMLASSVVVSAGHDARSSVEPWAFRPREAPTPWFQMPLGLKAQGSADRRPNRETLDAWDQYIATIEARMAQDDVASGPFLAIDAPALAGARQNVLDGSMVVAPIEVRAENGREIEIPDALVHHWRGDVLIPGATVSDVVSSLETSVPPASPDDVIASRVIDRGPGWIKVGLRLRRQKVLTVVYATEHLVTFHTIAPGRARSVSIATRIVEIEQAGTPREHEAAPDDDHGFLWRWRVYWRFEQTPAGVVAECESVSLSRSVPAMLRLVAAPFIDAAARESMEKALQAMRAAFGLRPLARVLR
jgi:hypothetical protein